MAQLCNLAKKPEFSSSYFGDITVDREMDFWPSHKRSNEYLDFKLFVVIQVLCCTVGFF
jgi:hypothetical protein